jgi:enoyl-CoA hydratase/3-hydroxyacyl-CoA dehydrogenase
MRTFNRIGIVGAGTMGSALAQKFAQEGFPVILVDREDRFLDRGLEAIQATLQEGVQRKLFTPEQVETIVGRITPTVRYDPLAQCQLVIEAVFEDPAVKRAVFQQISAAVPAETVIATNTSSFSVTECAQAVSHPERFIGLHFFYHAAKNRLVEIVRGATTDDDTFADMLLLMQRCGKDPIFCRDSSGFVVNRFFVPWLNEAVRIYAEGLAGPAAIDAACRKTFGCGLGPFALMNATGVPIAYHAQQTLEQAFGDFYRPADALRRQAEANQPWPIDPEPEENPEAANQIGDRMLGVVFLVCTQLLAEKVCTAGDINRGARIGLRWRRGPLELYRRLGPDTVHRLAEAVAARYRVPLPDTLTADHWQPDYLAVERQADTVQIVLNRPEDLNALNPEVARQLESAFDAADRDPAVKTVVLTGRGKAFMAGADIKFFINHIRAGTIPEIVAFTKTGQDLLQRIDASAKQVVAVVNGLALGGGLELALAADTILAFEKALLAFPETGIGIYPGLGGTQRTVRRVGPGLAKYLIFTGKFLSAGEALEIGLIDRIIDWNDLPRIASGDIPAPAERPPLAERWELIQTFFERYSTEQLLDPEFVPPEPFDSTAFQRLRKQIRRKAPLALKEAERLINEQRGPASELEALERIFASEDALAGLRSVGGPPPEFKGR